MHVHNVPHASGLIIVALTKGAVGTVVMLVLDLLLVTCTHVEDVRSFSFFLSFCLKSSDAKERIRDNL